MKTFLVSLVLYFAASFVSFSKAPEILWTKWYGGKETDRTYNICETSDGGFLSCAQSNSFLKFFSTWLVRMDSKGDTLWTKILGDTLFPEQVKSMEETSDGGYIVCGAHMLSDYKYHPYLIKLDSTGSFKWGKIITTSKLAETGIMALESSDDGYIVAVWLQGAIGSMGMGIYKTDKMGSVVDSAFYDWEYYDKLESISLTNDGGYVLAGTTNSFSFSTEFDDMFLMKINKNLDSLWIKLYGTNDSLSERLGNVEETSDYGFLIVGAQAQYPKAQNSHDVYLVKTDINGNELWKRKYGGTGHEVGFYSVELQNNGYIICGTGAAKGGSFDAYVLRLKSNGDTIWTKYYGTTGFDELLKIKPVKSGGYILAGTSYFYSADPNKQDLYFIRLADDNTDMEEQELDDKMITIISPNPASDFIEISGSEGEVRIWDVFGRDIQLRIENYELRIKGTRIDVSGLSPGVYFVRIGARVEKFVKI